jgi:hypothetical protein
MLAITTVVDTYIAMWNETDPEKRLALISETLNADATYIDPAMSGNGVDDINAMIAATQNAYLAYHFILQGEPDSHHDYLRFTWTLARDGEEPIAIGTDFATVANDGRLASVVGFLEPVE